MEIAIRRSDSGCAVAITVDGWDVLQLDVGSSRNEACVQWVVDALECAHDYSLRALAAAKGDARKAVSP